jgi:hypothetical protein
MTIKQKLSEIEQRAKGATPAAIIAYVPRLIRALRHEMETSERVWHADDRDQYLRGRRAGLAAILEGKEP